MKHKRFRLGGDRVGDDPTVAQQVSGSSIAGDLNQVYILNQLLHEQARPTKQVVVGDIPGVPPAFVHRETFEQLSTVLDEHHVAVVCALTGMRGVGKTQLAAAYARAKIASGCSVVGWINADTDDNLLDGLSRLAGALNVADPEGDSRESARRLTEHLTTRGGDALLVLDNATDPVAVQPFLPPTGARVVLTSTERSFTELGEPVDVGSYRRSQSTGYLRKRTKLDDDAGADAVAAVLGDLPLALSSAAATIHLQGLHYRNYLERLNDRTIADLMPYRKGQHYPRSTTAALVLNLKTVAGDDPKATRSRVLGVVAMLSADGVPRDYLHSLASLGSGFDVDAIEEALAQCVSGSVLSWSHNREAVIMHQLVARVMREQSRIDDYFHQIATDAMDLLDSKQITRAEGWDRRDEAVQRATQLEAIWKALTENEPK